MARIAFGPAELETFLAIAELGSFSRAAERLSLSQPSISNRILRLEKLLGARLFERTTRAVVLTDAGMRLQARISPVIDELRAALEEFHRDAGIRRKTVTVAASPIVAAVLIPPVLQQFRQNFPETTIILRDDVSTDKYANLVAELKSGVIDIVVAALAVDAPNFDYEPLVQDECVVVAPRSSRLFSHGTVSIEALAREPFITLSAYMPDVEAVAADLRLQGIDFRPSFQVANVTTLLALVESGMGVALLPRFALRSSDGVETGRLRTARLMGASIVRRIGMFHLRRSKLVPIVWALSQALKAEARRDGGFGCCTPTERQAPRLLAAMNS